MNETKSYPLDMVEINEIVERPGFRNATDDLTSLEKSIRELGLLFPLVVNMKNVLISGYRRIEACRRAGLKTVPVLRMEADEDSLRALDILIQENLCRRDLNATELEELIGRKKHLLGRLRWRNPWRKFTEHFRKWRREEDQARA